LPFNKDETLYSNVLISFDILQI